MGVQFDIQSQGWMKLRIEHGCGSVHFQASLPTQALLGTVATWVVRVLPTEVMLSATRPHASKLALHASGNSGVIRWVVPDVSAARSAIATTIGSAVTYLEEDGRAAC